VNCASNFGGVGVMVCMMMLLGRMLVSWFMVVRDGGWFEWLGNVV